MQDKVVIITGGSSGLGRATAELMIAEGARVVIADIDQAAGEAVANTIGAQFVRTDVGIPAEVEGLVTGTVAQFGRLDVMCNNAGVIATTPVLRRPTKPTIAWLPSTSEGSSSERGRLGE